MERERTVDLYGRRLECSSRRFRETGRNQPLVTTDRRLLLTALRRALRFEMISENADTLTRIVPLQTDIR